MSKVLKKLVTSFLNKGVNPFHDYPFGMELRATKEEYFAIWKKAKQVSYPNIDENESRSKYRIDQYWLHELALHTQVVIKESEICYQHGRLLYATLSDYVCRNGFTSINILETGTARGFSSLCFAKALKDQNQEGRIVTIDPLPHHVKMYWNCIDDLDGVKTRRELISNYSDLTSRYIIFLEGTSKNLLERLELSRIHFAFLDGAHDYEDVKLEIGYVVPRQKKGDIIFFDDFQVTFFPGIVKAVKELESEGEYRLKTMDVNE